ncbi:BTAD domain-containing putative transcriptional regulator [Lentzea kentuckyensis]|uniref:BTAD domain-containing putative transcriptional regulator n=1 Tax=Lentzea kentuckyensis TaxID=360086 RepID=UPI000A36FCD0|nr:BTAD domain-containing putative transcriptional regulator [Lentzea kentuckyensis]
MTGADRRSALSVGVGAARGLLALGVLSALTAGLPWGLVHFVGWPLPDHVPTWDEVRVALLSPMGGQFFIDALAIVCWIAWFFFVLSVLRSVVDVARGIAWTPCQGRGPFQALTATLIGAVVLTLLSNRAFAAPAAGNRAHEPTAAVAVAPLTPGAAEHPAALALVVDRAAPAPPGLVRVVDEVRLPHNGIYDSLWRIAERIYGPGGGDRWPELYQLNRGVEQADGRSLSNPDLVRPGWQIAAYVPEPAEAPPLTEVRPTPPNPAPSEEVAEPREDLSEPGLNLMTGVYVSLGLAGAISAAVVAMQMRRRCRYRIGSGKRSDLHRPVAPVVQALRVGHETTQDRQSDETEFVHFGPRRPNVQLTAEGVLEPSKPSRLAAAAGTRRGREFAVDLASTRGLGLSGAGAAAAARALLLHLLTAQETDATCRVLVPADDLHLVFGEVEAQSLPHTVEVVASLDAALDEMEALLLTRARQALDEHLRASDAVVLVARSVGHTARRLQAVLDNGSALGLAGILLGQWRPGATVIVRADGTVSATSPGLGDELSGARLFNLPAADAADLLAVLREAEVQRGSDGVNDDVRSIPDARLPEPRASTVADAATADSAPAAVSSRLTVEVFGRFQFVFAPGGSEAVDLSGLLTPKQREVLVHLALHPQGVRREVLNEAVWPGSRPPRPYNSFHNTLSVLRRVVADATSGPMANFVVNSDGRYQLNREFVEVDFWKLQQLLGNVAVTGADRKSCLQRAVDLYAGDLAEDVLSPWIEPFRESARRDVLDALSALINEYGDADPQRVLVLLERARQLDPYNEGVYRQIMSTQAQLGQLAAVPRTLALLTATLGEIDEEPSPDTQAIAALLQRRSGPHVGSSGRAAAS